MVNLPPTLPAVDVKLLPAGQRVVVEVEAPVEAVGLDRPPAEEDDVQALGLQVGEWPGFAHFVAELGLHERCRRRRCGGGCRWLQAGLGGDVGLQRGTEVGFEGGLGWSSGGRGGF